ncbi:MAG: adenylosuccinate synthase [Deltaproteobacteria bacterium]|nr:adenylosuccinate synthase [Deltaproteobacteria bacterium]
MPIVIVVGAQWGDEGKGKVVDYLAEKTDLVVRFQGGNNAGHTLVVDGKKVALKLIPSGILRNGVRCLLASGVVVDPIAFIQEIDELSRNGITISPKRLGLAGEIQLILPYHKALDTSREAIREGDKLGTTGRGIGPAYEDAVSRLGVRLIDLASFQYLESVIARQVEEKNRYLKSVLGSSFEFSAEAILADLKIAAERLLPYVTNVSLELEDVFGRNGDVLFEGAQGTLLDVSHGTYPYVTSSNTLAGFASVSAGFDPRRIDRIIGVCKAYCTRVGEGPFPTQDNGADGELMRQVGQEFGTVTGRPRRCGWLDLVALKKAVRLNGIDQLVITKLDVLSGFATIKLAVSYMLDGKEISELPISSFDVARAIPCYDEMPGWSEDLSSVRSFDELPITAKEFLRVVGKLLNCDIFGFSIGPSREQTIIV